MVHVVNSFEMNNTHSLYEVEVSFSLILSNSFKVFNWDQLEYMPNKKQIKKGYERWFNLLWWNSVLMILVCFLRLLQADSSIMVPACL